MALRQRCLPPYLEGDRQRCLHADMDGYVSKPIDANELFAVIDHVSHAA
jgi:CheY-like chemotaxis protein